MDIIKNRKNILISVLILTIVTLIISKIYLYKSSLKTQIHYGNAVRNIETYNLVVIPREVIGVLQNKQSNQFEKSLIKRIEEVDTARVLTYGGVRGFHDVKAFIDNTAKDLKKINELIQQNGDKKEIDALTQQIIKKQKKSLKTFEDIEMFTEQYLKQKNRYIKILRDDEYENLLWYKNNEGYSQELITIIKEGLSE